MVRSFYSSETALLIIHNDILLIEHEQTACNTTSTPVDRPVYIEKDSYRRTHVMVTALSAFVFTHTHLH